MCSRNTRILTLTQFQGAEDEATHDDLAARIGTTVEEHAEYGEVQAIHAALAARQTELDRREAALNRREAELFVAEQRVASLTPPRTFRPTTSTYSPESTQSGGCEVEVTMSPVAHPRRRSVDNSIGADPPSPWYIWYLSTPGAPAPASTVPYLLPQCAIEVISPKADADEHARLLKLQLPAQPPLARKGPLPLGRWSAVTIVSVMQAHNLRHWAVTECDKFAARVYRQVVTVGTEARSFRPDGVRYLLRTFSQDSPRFPKDIELPISGRRNWDARPENKYQSDGTLIQVEEHLT